MLSYDPDLVYFHQILTLQKCFQFEDFVLCKAIEKSDEDQESFGKDDFRPPNSEASSYLSIYLFLLSQFLFLLISK